MISDFLRECALPHSAPPLWADEANATRDRFFAVVDSIARAARADGHPDLDWPAAYDGIEDEAHSSPIAG